jgi:hypothetical protein
MKQSQRTDLPSIRLLAAGVCSLVLLAGIGFSLFAQLEPALGRLIPAGLCVFILVILTHVVISGSWPARLLALFLAIFPTLLLFGMILFFQYSPLGR